MIPSEFGVALVNHLWQSTVVVALAWLLALALRKNHARVRYWVWFAASVKFVLPFSLLMSAGEWLRSLFATPIVAKPALANAMEQIAQPFPQAQFFDAGQTPVAAHHGNLLAAVLLTIWICGALIVAFRFGRGWLRVHAAKRNARPLALAADVPVLSSPASIEPGIFGIFRPVLLLPEGILERLTPEQMQAIVAHEMCHVRRRDNLTFAAHMIVEALFWFHPVVWWIGARLIEERERACDEAVLQSGSEAETYAEGILNVCKFYVESPLECVAGVSGSDLKKRILQIMTRYAGRKMSLGRKLLLGAAALAAVTAPVLFGLAQAREEMPDWQKRAGGAMEFEVASVKTNRGDNPRPDMNIPMGPGAIYEPVGERFHATDLSVTMYIRFAYKLSDNQVEEVVKQLPDWARTERFDIEAHAEGTPTKDQMRLMMQALLKERFGFAMHYQMREAAVYALKVAKPGKLGAQLRPHPENAACVNQFPVNEAGHIAPPQGPETDSGGFPAVCGGIVGVPSKTPGTFALGASNITMKLIADSIPGFEQLEWPVLDQTGLSGNYDFWLEWTSQSNRPAPTQGENVPSPDSPGTALIEALKDQLGLKLVATKLPVEMLMIDHVERPSPD